MRWVFYSLLTLNIVYLVWSLVAMTGPRAERLSQVPRESAPSQLQLLSESGQPSGQTGPSDKAERLCPVIGHWSSASEASSTLNDLKGLGYQAEVRPVKVQKDQLHWVYLPPYASRDKALKVLDDLQAKGVDSFIVSDGEDQNAISLGYFSSMDSAKGLRMKMRSAGYPAEIKDTSHEVTEYWIYVDSSAMPDDGSALRNYLSQHTSLQAENSGCQSQPGESPSTDDGVSGTENGTSAPAGQPSQSAAD